METKFVKAGAIRRPISTHGLDTFFLETLRVLFKEQLKEHFYLADADEGAVLIIKISSDDDLTRLKEQQKQHPKRPVIILQKDKIKGIQGKNISFLDYPVTPRKITEALYKALHTIESRKLSSSVQKDNSRVPNIVTAAKDERLVSSMGDIDLNDPKQVKGLQFSEDKYLLGVLKMAYKKGQQNGTNIQIYTAHGVFQYYPRLHKTLVEENTFALRNLASVPDTVTSVLTAFDDDLAPEMSEGKTLECADALLWKSAVWASRGRLPIGADLDRPFSLKFWPNFTRWMLLPDAMDLSVLWLKQPCTLRKTFEHLDIPQCNVFTFYSAALALDLLEFDVKAQKSLPSGHKSQTIKKLMGKVSGFIKPELAAEK